MSALLIERLKARELPQQWAQQLNAAPDQTVTVRIETEAEEPVTETSAEFVTDNPAFGIWRDREDMADVQACVRKLRALRYTRE